MMLRGLRGVAAALALCLVAAACDEDKDGGDETPVEGPKAHPSTGESWTVLVYMVADNNLEPFALDDIVEMADVGSSAKLNIVVQADRSKEYSDDGLGSAGNWTTAKRLRVMPGALEVVGDLGEVNMGTPQTLSDFISWGVKTYPADRYAILFWDHGGAWSAFGVDDDAPGTSQGTDLLSLNELKSGIQSGMKAAGLSQFSLIGFDACLMSTVEVALAMRPFGEYLLASEETEPGHGWDWSSLSVLRQDPTTNPLVLGQKIIQGYQAQARQQKQDARITLSLTDLYALEDLDKAVAALAALYASTDVTLATSIGRGRQSTLEFGASADPAQAFNMLDLGDLVANVSSQTSAAAAVRTQMSAALAKAVVAKVNGPQTSDATGLAIYFPPAQRYYDTGYSQLTEMRTWQGFLSRYFGGAGSVTVHPSFTTTSAQADVSSSGMVLNGQLTSGTAQYVTKASLFFGYSDDNANRLVILGDKPAQVSGSTVTSSWNISALKLTQGAKSGDAYLSLEVGSDGGLSAFIPLAYKESSTAQTEFVLRTIVFDSAGNVTQDAYYAVTEGAASELRPAAGSVLYPLVQVYDLSSGEVSFDILSSGSADFDATQAISLTFEKLPQGRSLFGILSVEDFTGEGDAVLGTGVVP